MARSLPAEEIRDEYEEAVRLVEAGGTVEFINGSPSCEQQVNLRDYTLSGVVELGQNLDVDILYGILEERDDGTAEWARVYFLYHDIVHVQYVESAELARIRESETEEQVEEHERKQDLAEELLDRYGNVLTDAQEYRLTHNLEDMRMDRLFQLQDRLQEQTEQKEREERISEELEQDLAEELYQDHRFNQQFNETDTKMLLRQMDLEFDEERIRFEAVHRQAKSLLKVNQ
jgi:hypothetical protein